jgi:hypothetical protein
MAKELNVDQSTISKDMRYIKDEAKRIIIKVTENLSFEYVSYLAAIEEIVRELWKIANTEIDPVNNTIDPNTIIRANINNKNRIAALTVLLETYKHRMEIMTGGWKTTHDHVGATIINHGYSMKEQMKTPKQREQERIDNLRMIANI